eukprot:357002-Chlamydomonas_euryale.AAC.9
MSRPHTRRTKRTNSEFGAWSAEGVQLCEWEGRAVGHTQGRSAGIQLRIHGAGCRLLRTWFHAKKRWPGVSLWGNAGWSGAG